MKPEVTDETGLIGTGGFEAASGHEQEDYRAMDLVAGAEADRGLVCRGMKSALVVELHVPFELGSEIVADYQAGDPAVRSLVDELITDFVIHVDGAEFSGELEGQEE